MVAACLALQNYGLHNTSQGVTRALQHQLERQTAGSTMYADVAQWANDLDAPIPTGPSAASQYLQQVIADAAAVSKDCAALRVRNVLGGG